MPPKRPASKSVASARIRVTLFEKLAVIGEALQMLLATQADFDAVALSDVDEFLASVPAATLVLLSSDSLRDDLWVMMRRVKELAPDARIAVIGVETDPQLIAQALAEGADGFLHKRADPIAFLTSLRQIARGQTIVLGDALVRTEDASLSVVGSLPSRLTQREVQVIRLLAEDCTAQQMASALGVSLRTVHAHLHNAYGKLDVHGRLGAVTEARRSGVLDG